MFTLLYAAFWNMYCRCAAYFLSLFLSNTWFYPLHTTSENTCEFGDSRVTSRAVNSVFYYTWSLYLVKVLS